MKLSVIIPVYNEEVRIGECLGFLARQSRKPDEIIIVDNNSTDRSVEIAQGVAGVKVVQEKKQGMAYARDRGFLEARGDIICQTDADTRVPRDWLEKIEKFFVSHPAVSAVSGPVVFFEFPYSLFGSFPSYLAAIILGMVFGHPVIYGPNKAVRDGVFNKITPCSSDTGLHEDFDFAEHIAAVGKIAFVRTMPVLASARRVYKTPKRFFVDYTLMLIKNIKHNVRLRSGSA